MNVSGSNPRLSRANFRLALLVGSLAVHGAAQAIIIAPPSDPCAEPVIDFGQAAARVAVAPVVECKPLTGVAQPGVTNATLAGSSLELGGTLGSVVGSALGGGTGQFTAGGFNRTALGAQTGQAAAAGGARWNLWAAYSRLDVGYSFQPLQSGGHANLFLGGVDYTFSDSLVAGVAITDERTRIDTSYNGGRISGDGNTVAPYLGWRINRNWMLDASVGFGDTRLNTTDNSVAGGITGANKVKRTMGSVGLSYSQAMGTWLLVGKGSLLSVENRFSAFTLSNAAVVDATTVRTSQVRLGGQAMYNSGSFVPYVGVAYIYDIEHANQGVVAGQNAANDRDAWQVRLGVNFRSTGALYGGVSLVSDVGRSQVKNDQFLVNVGVRF